MRAARSLDIAHEKAAPVVLHANTQRVTISVQMDSHPRGVGVLADVGQRLLNDAQELDFRHRGKFGARPFSNDQFNGDAGQLAVLRQVVLKRRHTIDAGREAGAQPENRLAHVQGGVARHFEESLQFGLGDRNLSSGEMFANYFQFEGQVAEGLAQAVVQLAADAFAFLQQDDLLGLGLKRAFSITIEACTANRSSIAWSS